MRRSVVLVASLVAIAGGAGCSQTDYDGGALRADLVATGLTRDQATCVVREMEREFEVERLGAREEPGDDEHDDFARIYETCTGVALPQ